MEENRIQAETVTVKELNTRTLADLIAKRQRCLLKLRDLGIKQSELISTGEMGPLLRLLSAKNQWIGAVQTIEKELAPYHEQDPEKRDWPSAAARSQCAAQASECKELLEEIVRLERQNEEMMTRRRDQVANQLQTAQVAGTVCTAYQAQQNMLKPGSPHFAGNSSESNHTADHLPTSQQ